MNIKFTWKLFKESIRKKFIRSTWLAARMSDLKSTLIATYPKEIELNVRSVKWTCAMIRRNTLDQECDLTP